MQEQQVVCTGGVASSDEPPPAATSRRQRREKSKKSTEPDDWLTLTQSPAWRDWRWQMRNRIRTLGRLAEVFPGLKPTTGMSAAVGTFPMAIPPYYASLIRSVDTSDPVFQMCVPQVDELMNPAFLSDDPLGEDHDMPVPGLVHRYPDRALLVSTSVCASYCRHCTRKRVAGQVENVISPAHIRGAVDYLKAHPEIKDVVVSGGDPFTMATPVLERILRAVRSVSSVEIIRIGTRTPVVMPMRITDELVQMLRKYHPVFVNTHFNHPYELTADARAACLKLVDAGVPMGNQTVLLRGVNDSAEILSALFRELVKVRVKPYYLFQCDLVKGVEHFRTPLATGVEIMARLRGRLSGLAIPTFVVDAPHGGGKIPVLPNYIVARTEHETVLRNYEGVLTSYPEPQHLAAAEQLLRQAADPEERVYAAEPALAAHRGGMPAETAGSRRQQVATA